VRDPASRRQTVWMLIAALALSALPWRLFIIQPPVTCEASSSEREREERTEEPADAPNLNVFVLRRQGGSWLPTNARLVLRVPRSSAPPRPILALVHEDPRRVLIPLRLDPPPDGHV
jgi:hypothetical protein